MRNLFPILLISLVFLIFIACDDSNSDPGNGGDSDKEFSETDQERTENGVENDNKTQLMAAVATRIITPDKSNHPCDMFLGGTGSNRRAEGVHDDLEAGAVLLKYGDEHIILVSMDLVGLVLGDTTKMMQEIAKKGYSEERVIISSTHTHSAPDSIGIWGPDEAHSGRCPEYLEFLTNTISDMVDEMEKKLVEVQIFAANTQINETDSNKPSLLSDLRKPDILNNNLALAKLVDANDKVVATIVNWHNHPETMIKSKTYSADFPRWTRKKIEDEIGGKVVYFSGTVGGLMSNIFVDVPERNEKGEPVLNNGKPVLVSEDNEQKNWSMGYIVGEWALKALKDAKKVESTLRVKTKTLALPLTNFMFNIGITAGLIPPFENVIDDEENCGSFGCIPTLVHHIQIGTLHIISLPGEVLPETSVGRPESVEDFGEEWGEWTFPAITGYRSALPAGHILMEFGLSNNEIGYVLPEADVHPGEHPENYEEYFMMDARNEKILREGVTELLKQSTK